MLEKIGVGAGRADLGQCSFDDLSPSHCSVAFGCTGSFDELGGQFIDLVPRVLQFVTGLIIDNKTWCGHAKLLMISFNTGGVSLRSSVSAVWSTTWT